MLMMCLPLEQEVACDEHQPAFCSLLSEWKACANSVRPFIPKGRAPSIYFSLYALNFIYVPSIPCVVALL